MMLRRAMKLVMLAMSLVLLTGCENEDASAPGSAAQSYDRSVADGERLTSQSPTDVKTLRIVFLGDSLTAGYGVDLDQAFPAVLGRMLSDAGVDVRIVNAGVSGDTTAGGLSRLDWVLRQKPDVVVVGLGGNDGLRGIDPKASEANLRAIIEQARNTGAKVLLLGMLMPPNYGPEYTAAFSEIYPRIARLLDVPLVPFLLEGIGGDPDLNLPDGIHPTVLGHQRAAKNVLPHLRELIDSGDVATQGNDAREAEE